MKRTMMVSVVYFYMASNVPEVSFALNNAHMYAPCSGFVVWNCLACIYFVFKHSYKCSLLCG